ncbi:MAG: glycosyltransferase family 2 protein [Alphaproteobacteria bacterium]|nr:glycosyltransferase family 2 protein [Alphaproteobacteria bacterium]
MSQTASLPRAAAQHEAAARARAEAPELSIIIPTYKESGNVALVVQRLEATLEGLNWEAIFVDDDSPDGTASSVKTIAASDTRVRCLRRVIRRGLAGACIEGMLASSAPYVAVMDADLQHDERLLPKMLAILKQGQSDMVVGSRYVAGGSAEGLSKTRGAMSRVATSIAHRWTTVRLTDPMSGFFMMRRDKFDPLAASLSTQGFKILLDIVITANGKLRIVEEPYVFGTRQHGQSKLDAQVGLDFLGFLLTKLTGGAVTPRFFSFALVGTIGLGVHLIALRAGLIGLALPFVYAQILATMVAMTGNFFLNNQLTYRDKRLTGWSAGRGLLSFYAVSAVGALTNVGAASWLYAYEPVWWLAGIAGALVGAVWNYALSNVLVWRVK